MEEQSATRRVLVAVVEGRRQRGRQKLRWEDGLMEDARKLGGEGNWRNVARNRDSWQKLLKKASAQWGAVVPMVMMMMKYKWLQLAREFWFQVLTKRPVCIIK